MPGEIASIATMVRDGETYILGASAPGRFANLELMDPGANDSDSDGMPDGWELAYGLDPTDPWDALLDGDVDGLRLSGDGQIVRNWTNLDEYRYVARTPEGYNSTLPESERLRYGRIDRWCRILWLLPHGDQFYRVITILNLNTCAMKHSEKKHVQPIRVSIRSM